jgi:tetratricopeptide (TPR) repeat protein
MAQPKEINNAGGEESPAADVLIGEEESLSMVEKDELPVYYVNENKLEDTFTLENIKRFVAGDLTWAQLQGMTMEEAYAIAEQAFTLFSEGKQTDAKTIVEALVLANPKDGYLRGLLASFYQRMDLVDEAIEEYQVAIELNPSNLKAQVNLGELLLKAGRFEDAMKHLQAAVSLDANGNDPATIRAKALARATAAVMEQLLKSKKK